MKRVALLTYFLFGMNAVSTAAAQDFYANFALVVQLPSYETFITNLGDSPIRVDGYTITSQSGSLRPDGWARLGSAGPEVVAALGAGVAQFLAANPNKNSLAELNPFSSATWQPGQSWSIGFPFNSHEPNFIRDAVFRFSSPDGFVLTGGTVVPPSQLSRAAFIIIPEPSVLAGDYNKDGAVNAADYVAWRDSVGQAGSGLVADGNGNNLIDDGDFNVWREHFGQVVPIGAGSPAVPEPTNGLLLILGAAFGVCRAYRVTHRSFCARCGARPFAL